VVDDGVTGFVVDDEDRAVEAVRAAQALDRREVRRRFDRRFSATAMARAYLDLYADRLARLPYASELASNRREADISAAFAQSA
jgi:glycosyltransferase involved in cell wall biosynthesis